MLQSWGCRVGYDWATEQQKWEINNERMTILKNYYFKNFKQFKIILKEESKLKTKEIINYLERTAIDLENL